MGSFVAAGWEECEGYETSVVGCCVVGVWVRSHSDLTCHKGRIK